MHQKIFRPVIQHPNMVHMNHKHGFSLGLALTLTFFSVPVDAQPAGDIFVRAKHSDKCLHIREGSQGNGLPATQWECIRQNNVLWRFVQVPREPGFYFIKVKSSDKCIQVNGQSKENGAVISQWDCVNQNNVKWSLARASDGYYYIKAKHSNKCLQVNGASQDNNAPITQWDCVNQPNVQWKFQSL
jgi:hypothetical protein